MVEGRFSVRGFWELLIKLIVLAIAIAAFIAYWNSQQREVPSWYWFGVLIFIALMISLILRQKHLVCLNCQLTEPTGCKHGDPNLLPGRVLEPIIGTATGIGFSRYELEVLWSGTLSIADAIVYADAAGNPDPTLTIGNHTVVNNRLGFVDIEKAVQDAGINILTSTSFEVRLHVIGLDGSRKTCTTTFSITAARAYIKFIGAGWAHDVIDPDESLRRDDSSTAEEVAVGGRISVRGAADAYGCASEKIAKYSLWVKQDPTFTLPQPPRGTAYNPSANGWMQITEVTYTTDPQRLHNRLNGMPIPNWLTNRSTWSTRIDCTLVDNGIVICQTVPDLTEFKWNSASEVGTGKYSFLLKVEDTAGNTYYDIQRAWIDNKDVLGKIEGLAGVGPCQDIYILDLSSRPPILTIEGYATDPLIDSGDTTQPTSDNFREYKMWFQKQGAGPLPSDWVPLAIPLAGGSYPALAEDQPVPDRGTWTGDASDPPDPPTRVLAEWDLRWLDYDTNPQGLAAKQLLKRDESCTYTLMLKVWDKTIVHEFRTHWTDPPITFPVKIHNGHAPTP